MTSFYIRSLSIAFLTVLLEGVTVEGQAVGSPRVIISLDGQGWKLVGLGPGQGEKLGVNLHDSAKASSGKSVGGLATFSSVTD